MFNFKKVPDRESTREVLSRLKDQEKGQNISQQGYETRKTIGGVAYIDMGLSKKQEPSKDLTSIPEYNIENILKQISGLERRMKENTSNYLNLYYDLRKLEDKFVKAVEFARVNNIQIKENLLREIREREQVIVRRSKRSG